MVPGEVWSGNEALQLGLIDEVATIDDYAQKTWGKDPVIVTPPGGHFKFPHLWPGQNPPVGTTGR
jgi:ClpP class serine protease